MFDNTIKTIVITEQTSQNSDNTIYEIIDFSSSDFINNLMQILVKHQIQSIIIEGGKKTLQTFIDNNVWDEARVFIGQNNFTKGISAPKIHGKEIKQKNIHGDILKSIINPL